MKFERGVKDCFALTQRNSLALPQNKRSALVRIDKFAEIVPFGFVKKARAKFEIVNRHNFAHNEQIFDFVAIIPLGFLHRVTLS